MSQMQPEPDDLDYEPRFLPPEPDEMFDDTLWNERAWQPGYHPPGPRPPTGQPWPRPPFGGGPRPPLPPPSPGKWPFWGYWGFRMLNAWRDIKFLRRLVADMQADMLQEAIKDGIILPGPNSPVQPPGGGTAITGPILGVTDGSDAAPGQVGEFLVGSVDVPYAASPANTDTTVGVMVVPPGDWDMWAWMLCVADTFPNNVADAGFVLSPKPAGMSNDMQALMYTQSANGLSMNYISAARGSFSVPTLMPFSIFVHNQIVPGMNGGTATLQLECRRRR